MKIEKLSKNNFEKIKEIIAPRLISHPHFMFYCTSRAKRPAFISDFLDYHLYRWVELGQLYSSPNVQFLASLINIHGIEYKFHGKNALKLRLNVNAPRIFVHRENAENITKILVPPNIEARVLTLYGSSNDDTDDLKALVTEIKAAAEKDGFAVVYETFSRRLIECMESLGFETAYQRPFLGTQFVQTLMIYNVKAKSQTTE